MFNGARTRKVVFAVERVLGVALVLMFPLVAVLPLILEEVERADRNLRPLAADLGRGARRV